MGMIDSHLIAAPSMRAYFYDAFANASRNQAVDVDDMTSAYVINLLTTFGHVAALKAVSDEGRHHQALASIYAEATAAGCPQLRNQALQRLGDIALFISGIFTDSLHRKLVDVDYYIAMGETAYGSLHQAMEQRSDPFARAELFAELRAKFSALVDVLAEISELSGLKSHNDVVRTYEIWRRSGSERARKELHRFGIHPIGEPKPMGAH